MKTKLVLSLIGLFYLPAGLALSLNGFTEFASVLELNTSTAGVVQSVHVVAGQQVKKGDLLLSLDSTPHQARLDRALSIEKSLFPLVETAQMELGRAEELYARDSLSQVDLKNAENALAESEGGYQAAKSEVVLARYELAQTALYAPLDGVVLALSTNASRYVDPAVSGDTLVTLVADKKMKAIALVTSDQWNPALINKPASVTYRKRSYKGTVSFLGLKRIKQASGLPAYEVHVSFDADRLIPAEMPVAIEIQD